MVEVRRWLDAMQVGGGHCSACGWAMEDGKITEVTYGPRNNLHQFRLCPQCLKELHEATRELHHYTVMGAVGDGSTQVAATPFDAFVKHLLLDAEADGFTFETLKAECKKEQETHPQYIPRVEDGKSFFGNYQVAQVD